MEGGIERGGGEKIFKKGGKLGQGIGALKMGHLNTPINNGV